VNEEYAKNIPSVEEVANSDRLETTADASPWQTITCHSAAAESRSQNPGSDRRSQRPGLSAGRLATAVSITALSNSALENRSTAITKLVLIPVLDVFLLVAVLYSVGVADIRAATYASILLSFGLSVLTGAVGQVTQDRMRGVAEEVVSRGLWNPTYWTAKLAVPAFLSLVPAFLGALAVFAIDFHNSGGAPDYALFQRVLWLIPLSALVGALVGVTASIASFALEDPYLISNVANMVLLLTAGVVLPLSLYPTWLAAIARFLPFTALIEAVRTTGPAAPLLLREFAVALAWLAVGLLIAKRVLALIRSGKRAQQISML